jgi:hypothetical protein
MVKDTYKENLKERIKKNLKKNYHHDTLKYALIKQGYSRVLVEQCLQEAQAEITKEERLSKPAVKIEEPVVQEVVIEKKPWWKFW